MVAFTEQKWIMMSFPEQIAFRRALSSAFSALATLCAQAFAHKNVI